MRYRVCKSRETDAWQVWHLDDGKLTGWFEEFGTWDHAMNAAMWFIEMTMDDLEWCSIYGYDIPDDHPCIIAVCYNPHRDGQILAGTLEERIEQASILKQELSDFYWSNEEPM